LKFDLANPAFGFGQFYPTTTTDDFVTRVFGRLALKLELAHVKLYSTREYRTLFEKARLHYIISKQMFLSLKVHVAEKRGLAHAEVHVI